MPVPTAETQRYMAWFYSGKAACAASEQLCVLMRERESLKAAFFKIWNYFYSCECGVGRCGQPAGVKVNFLFLLRGSKGQSSWRQAQQQVPSPRPLKMVLLHGNNLKNLTYPWTSLLELQKTFPIAKCIHFFFFGLVWCLVLWHAKYILKHSSNRSGNSH